MDCLLIEVLGNRGLFSIEIELVNHEILSS